MNSRPFAFTECPLISGEENADILLDYCNRKLDPALVQLFDRHMEQCPACRAFAESQTAVWNALDAFDAMPVSEDFDARLFQRIERDEWGGWWSRLRSQFAHSFIWRPAVPIAAVLLLALGIWLGPGLSNRTAEPGIAAVASEKIDPEQVETALEDMEMLRQLVVADAAASRQM